MLSRDADDKRRSLAFGGSLAPPFGRRSIQLIGDSNLNVHHTSFLVFLDGNYPATRTPARADASGSGWRIPLQARLGILSFSQASTSLRKCLLHMLCVILT